MDHYAVIGQPVAHSLSPRIHALFAARAGHAISYEAIEVAPEALRVACWGRCCRRIRPS